MKVHDLVRTDSPALEPSRSSEPPADSPKFDGRVNRSVVTRKKIVTALTALIYEGCLSPTAEQVAERADIGLRTVFRHFDDMETLYREINSDLEALVMPMLSVRLVGNTWQDRLLHCAQLGSELHDRIAAMHLAGEVHRHESPAVAQSVMRAVSRQRELLMRILPAPIRQNTAIFEALDLLMSPDTWVRLRRDQQLSAEQALDVVRLGVNALIATTD